MQLESTLVEALDATHEQILTVWQALREELTKISMLEGKPLNEKLEGALQA